METFPAAIAQDPLALNRQQQMFDYSDVRDSEVFMQPDIALRRAGEIPSRLEPAERAPERPTASPPGQA
jgi:hypothetical protein